MRSEKKERERERKRERDFERIESKNSPSRTDTNRL